MPKKLSLNEQDPEHELLPHVLGHPGTTTIDHRSSRLFGLAIDHPVQVAGLVS